MFLSVGDLTLTLTDLHRHIGCNEFLSNLWLLCLYCNVCALTLFRCARLAPEFMLSLKFCVVFAYLVCFKSSCRDLRKEPSSKWVSLVGTVFVGFVENLPPKHEQHDSDFVRPS